MDRQANKQSQTVRHGQTVTVTQSRSHRQFVKSVTQLDSHTISQTDPPTCTICPYSVLPVWKVCWSWTKPAISDPPPPPRSGSALGFAPRNLAPGCCLARLLLPGEQEQEQEHEQEQEKEQLQEKEQEKEQLFDRESSLNGAAMCQPTCALCLHRRTLSSSPRILRIWVIGG